MSFWPAWWWTQPPQPQGAMGPRELQIPDGLLMKLMDVALTVSLTGIGDLDDGEMSSLLLQVLTPRSSSLPYLGSKLLQ